jgi:hypothetical protein
MTEAHNSLVVNDSSGLPIRPSSGNVCVQALRLSEMYDTHPDRRVVDGLSQDDSAELSRDSIKLHGELASLSHQIGIHGCSGVVDGHCPVARDSVREHADTLQAPIHKRILRLIGI